MSAIELAQQLSMTSKEADRYCFALREIEEMSFAGVNDADSLRDKLETIQAIARKALTSPGVDDGAPRPVAVSDGDITKNDAWAGRVWAFLNHVDGQSVDEIVNGFMQSTVDGCIPNESHRSFIARGLKQTIQGLLARAMAAEAALEALNNQEKPS